MATKTEIEEFWALPENMPFVTCENAQERLKYLRDTGKPWSEIASKMPFLGIPIGTLYQIYSSAKVPKKWRDQLGITPQYPPRIAISKDDPKSAARTIRNNLPREFQLELVELLLADELLEHATIEDVFRAVYGLRKNTV